MFWQVIRKLYLERSADVSDCYLAVGVELQFWCSFYTFQGEELLYEFFIGGRFMLGKRFSLSEVLNYIYFYLFPDSVYECWLSLSKEDVMCIPKWFGYFCQSLTLLRQSQILYSRTFLLGSPWHRIGGNSCILSGMHYVKQNIYVEICCTGTHFIIFYCHWSHSFLSLKKFQWFVFKVYLGLKYHCCHKP